jgi:hypothetical protein
MKEIITIRAFDHMIIFNDIMANRASIFLYSFIIYFHPTIRAVFGEKVDIIRKFNSTISTIFYSLHVSHNNIF